MVEHNNIPLVWLSSVLYSRIVNRPSDSVFEVVNDYLATLTPDTQRDIFALYVKAYTWLDSPDGQVTLQTTGEDEIKAMFVEMHRLLDYPRLIKWIGTSGRLELNDTITEVYTGTYPVERTYLKGEYEELAALAVLAKLAMPIWGTIAQFRQGQDKKYKEMECFRLWERSPVMETRGMLKLTAYCSSTSDQLGKNSAATVCMHMGTEEIPFFLVSKRIVRDIALGPLRTPGTTLIMLIFNSLRGDARTLGSGIKDKRSTRPVGGEKESVSEWFRASQKVADYTYIMAEEYMLDTQGCAIDLNEKADVVKVMSYLAAITNTPEFSIAPYHVPLCGLILQKVIHPKSLRNIKRDSMMSAIAVSAAWLSDNGYQEIANLMLAPRRVKEGDDMELLLAQVGGYPFTAFTRENKVLLEEMYPFQRRDKGGRSLGNPGAVMIDSMLSDIDDSVFPGGSDVIPDNIRNDIVSIIRRF